MRDDVALFEILTLEAFQSGLSWLTILRTRAGFRRAFDGFDVERVAEYREREVERLLADPSIVRHRGKIEATITNARAARRLRGEGERRRPPATPSGRGANMCSCRQKLRSCTRTSTRSMRP